MTRRHTFKYILTSLFLIFSFCNLAAEILQDNDFGYSLDIPEGFQIAESTDDGMSYHLAHPNFPVDLIIKLNNGQGFSNSHESLASNIKKLNAKIEQDDFDWNGSPVSIGSFSMKLDQNYGGWALCVPTKIDGYFLTLFCYAPQEKFAGCQQFIMSTLNSLCIDDSKFNYPGVIVSYAFPKEGKKDIKLQIGGKTISSSIDKSDEEAAQFVVDLEYSVLTLYGKHAKWKEAWQRYYRMIYRDSFYRLEKVSSDIYETLYPVAKKQNPQNADIAYAQLLLSWVQNFNYKRDNDPRRADFTCLPSVLTGTGNDCDSRSLLICTLLKSIDIECLLLVSPEYSHAMAAAGIKAPGQQYKLEGTDLEFIMGETTAKVTWGTIAQDQSDRTKWFPVILP